MKGGWFVGPFTPSVYNTKDVEVCVKYHHKGEFWDNHYHTVHEINVMVEGLMTINEQLFQKGDIFVVEPYEAAKPEFLTDCVVVVVKIPAKANDKINV